MAMVMRNSLIPVFGAGEWVDCLLFVIYDLYICDQISNWARGSFGVCSYVCVVAVVLSFFFGDRWCGVPTVHMQDVCNALAGGPSARERQYNGIGFVFAG